MGGVKNLVGLAALGLAVSAVPAQAVITTFATFAPLAVDVLDPNYSNFRWVNNGNGSNGTGGSLFSATTNAFGAPSGQRAVSFSFLIPALSPVATNIQAIYTWSGATAASQLATRVGAGPGSALTQSGIGGIFSFVSTAPITVNTTTYAAGSLLLGGTYGSAVITGLQSASTANFDANTTLAQTLTFTSAFVDFTGATDRAFALDLDNVRSALSALQTTLPPTTALRTFRSSVSGSFGADGDLLVIGVPEPQTWALMVLGFGMVGLQIRRRSRNAVTA